MQHFEYQAKDAMGMPVAGEVEAADVAEALAQLQERGLEVLAIQVMLPSKAATNITAQDSSRGDEKFRERLEELAKKSSGWVPALQALAEEMPSSGVRRELRKLLSRLTHSLTADDLLDGRDTAVLLPLVASNVESKAAAQKLHVWLAHASQQIELRIRRRRAMLYPCAVLLISAFLLALFAFFLMPFFRAMYEDMGLSLPAPTMVAIWVSDQLTTYWLRTLICVGVTVAVGMMLSRAWRKRALTNRLLGRWVAGTNGNLAAMSSFTGVLAELVGMDVPLAESLRIAGRSARHRYYADAADLLSADVSNGLQPSRSDAAQRLPPLVISALQIGPNETPNQSLLREISQMYFERQHDRMDWFTAGLPSLAMVVIGFVVGMMTVALFMPLVTMIYSLT